MELFLPFARFVPVLVMAMVFINIPVYGQINNPCNASVISSFTPCMNYLTNSTGNGTSPSADCCNSLTSLTSGSRDCLCLIVTGNVPIQLPINRSLAISLPRACNMPGVPLQCKGNANLYNILIYGILLWNYRHTNANFCVHLQPLVHLLLLRVPFLLWIIIISA